MNPSTRLSLRRIAAFLPVFTAEGFQFASLTDSIKQEGNVITLAGPSYDPEVYRFLDVLSQTSLTRLHSVFPWPEWIETDEATRLRTDPEALAQATPEQLAKLLTVFARQERFCDGAMLSFYESGLLTGILRRAHVLAEENERTTP